ncbi:MAG TPA: GAF domain-containing protein [Ktedonobacteraceae bacterium]
MRDIHEVQTWRELLGIIISEPKERQRLIDVLNVTSITLTRWVSGESDPRPQNLRHLLSVLPQHRDRFIELLKKERGLDEFSNPVTEEVTSGEIPAEFYARVFVARATMTDSLRFWSTCNLILQQALGQLDPDRQGMSIWVVKCMPPSGPYNKVRSLREIVGQGTHPWSGNLEQQAMFLGAESLAGNVVTLCRPGIIENLDEEHNLMPAARVDFEKSAAIYPILYEGRIAGVLLISSTEYNHFLLQTRTALAQSYADLIALSFEENDFYSPEDIALCVMPSHNEQKQYFAKFRRLIADTMIVAASNNRPVNNIEADQIVWQRLEEKLLQLSIDNKPL